ncbi:MAG TPA: hypothetical protein ENJ60_06470 [Aeromonadales bacterium]|nr:hypothetical protein [Aeromonadales bacterium]
MREFIFILILLTISATHAADTKTQFGVGLGTPGGLNLVAKGFINDTPVQFSIGTAGSGLYGLEAGYSFYFDDSSSFRSSQMVVGVIYAEYVNEHNSPNYPYIGVTTTFQWGGFYIEPGLSLTYNRTAGVLPNLQFGFLW